MKISELKVALPFLMNRRVPTLLIGAHGTGKTQFLKEATKKMGFDRFVDIRLGSQSDAGDLLGLQDFVRNEKGESVATKFMKPHWWPKDGEKVFIFLDEINRGTRQLLQLAFQLVLDYRLNEFQLPTDGSVYVGAAMNPDTGDYSGLVSMDDRALLSRFCQIKFTPAYEEFTAYGREKGFDPTFMGFIMENEKILDQTGLEDFSISAKPDRRALERVDQLIRDGLPEDLYVEIIGGMLGLEVATKYLSYARNNRNKPLDGDTVLNKYKKAGKKTVLDYLASNRQDLVSVTTDNVLESIKNGEGLTEKQGVNLREYLLDIPRDIAHGMLEKLTEGLDTNNAAHKKTSGVMHDTVIDDKFMEHFACLEEKQESGDKTKVG